MLHASAVQRQCGTSQQYHNKHRASVARSGNSRPVHSQVSQSRVFRLQDLGPLRGGYVASSATVDHPGPGRFSALQAGDITARGRVDWSTLRYVEPVRDGERYGITEGDVLLPLRSTRNIAVVARDVPPNVIAVGHWAIISPDPELVEPDFLAWYLNHPATAPRLAALMRGTKLRFLSLTDLRAFEVELPALRVQQRIARVHALNERIAGLERELAHARRQLVDTVTMRALRGAPHHPTSE